MKEENGNDKERRKKLINFLDSLLKHLRDLTISTYYQAIEKLRADIESGADFTWDNNGTAEKKIIDLFKILEGNINLLIANGVSNWYQEGLTAAEEQVINELKGKGIIKHNRDVKLLKEQATEERRMEAVAGHAQTVTYRNGALNNLSNRIWDFKGNAKKEIETIIQEAIKAGKGVNEAKNSVKEFLNTDGNGKMKHSGAGVYNTNLKNCERLMRTEINAAYRSAEIDSYQGMDVVLGFRINLSGNHYTKNGNKPPKPLHDICDECAGDYPKNFVWFGWHPNCRCYITPITMSPAQFAAYMEADDQGKGEEYLETIRVKDFPDGFKNYYAEHSKQFALKPPQWVRQNPQLKLPAAATYKELPTVKEINEDDFNKFSLYTNFKTFQDYKKSILYGFDFSEFNEDMNKIFEEFGIQIKKKDFRVKSKEATILFEGEQNKLDLSRYFFYRDGEKIVNHTRFKLTEDLQGIGISKAVLKAFYKQYKNCGIKRIELHANDEIGGWAWARYGFCIPSKDEALSLVKTRASIKNKPKMEAIIEDYYNNKDKNMPFPMNKLAEYPEFKEDILGSGWWGYLDLTDKKQVKVFENYLDSK